MRIDNIGGSTQISSWDPVAKPNLVKSGSGQNGQAYLVLKKYTGNLDGITTIEGNSLIVFANKKWNLISSDQFTEVTNRVLILEGSVFFSYKGEIDIQAGAVLPTTGMEASDTYVASTGGLLDLDDGAGLTTVNKNDLIYRTKDNTKWLKLSTASQINDEEISKASTHSSQKTFEIYGASKEVLNGYTVKKGDVNIYATPTTDNFTINIDFTILSFGMSINTLPQINISNFSNTYTITLNFINGSTFNGSTSYILSPNSNETIQQIT